MALNLRALASKQQRVWVVTKRTSFDALLFSLVLDFREISAVIVGINSMLLSTLVFFDLVLVWRRVALSNSQMSFHKVLFFVLADSRVRINSCELSVDIVVVLRNVVSRNPENWLASDKFFN